MVTIFLAQGFEEMEALAPLDLLRRAGIPVQTAAVTDSPLSADEKAAEATEFALSVIWRQSR